MMESIYKILKNKLVISIVLMIYIILSKVLIQILKEEITLIKVKQIAYLVVIDLTIKEES